jgi:hypothetical protein
MLSQEDLSFREIPYRDKEIIIEQSNKELERIARNDWLSSSETVKVIKELKKLSIEADQRAKRYLELDDISNRRLNLALAESLTIEKIINYIRNGKYE